MTSRARQPCALIVLLTLTACATDETGDGSGRDASGRDIGRADTGVGADRDAGVPDLVDDSGDLTADLEPPLEVGLVIAVDYRFDTAGLLSSPAARGVVEEAARQWGLALRDDFESIPAGQVVYTRNPEDTSIEEYVTLEAPIDDLLVFVGSAFRSSSAAGASATAAFPAEEDDPVLRANLMERWEGDDFEPWTGWIQYNNDRTWFFDESLDTGDDIPADATDALSVTLHELGHILGVAPGGAFGRWVDGDSFVGPTAMAVYGGPVPLADGFGHIAEDVTIDGQTPIMATGRLRGQRYVITRLDLAMLADVGYEVEGLD